MSLFSSILIIFFLRQYYKSRLKKGTYVETLSGQKIGTIEDFDTNRDCLSAKSQHLVISEYFDFHNAALSFILYSRLLFHSSEYSS